MENPSIAADKLLCPVCGSEMNHHANKLLQYGGEAEANNPGSSMIAMYACPACGSSASQALQA